MGKKLYVGNLNYQTTEDDLQAKFTEFGSVSSVKLITDRDTGRSKGFAFVEMGSEDEAQATIDALDGQEFAGRNVKVNIAKDRGGDRSFGRPRR